MSAWVSKGSLTGRRFFDKLGWRPSGELDQLDLYGAGDNRLVEYLRKLESVELSVVSPDRPVRSNERRSSVRRSETRSGRFSLAPGAQRRAHHPQVVDNGPAVRAIS